MSNTNKWITIFVSLVFAAALVACGDDDSDENNDGNNGNNEINETNGTNGPTVTQSEFVEACLEHDEVCEPHDDTSSENDCESVWEFDMENAVNPGGCVDNRVAGWECLVAEDCGDGDGPACAEEFVAIGEYCQPE